MMWLLFSSCRDENTYLPLAVNSLLFVCYSKSYSYLCIDNSSLRARISRTYGKF